MRSLDEVLWRLTPLRLSQTLSDMYKIVGADQKEYGPITEEQLRQWIAEGRANGQTLAKRDDGPWQPVATFAEFAALFGAGAATPSLPPPLTSTTTPTTPLGSYTPVTTLVPAEQMVQGPAIGLLVVAILGLVGSVGTLLMHLSGAALLPGLDRNAEPLARILSGTFGVVSAAISIALSALILWGGLKMKRLENYGLAMTASIIAIIPCFSPCCLVGIPLGIWAVVVLSKPEVKAAFH